MHSFELPAASKVQASGLREVELGREGVGCRIFLREGQWETR